MGWEVEGDSCSWHEKNIGSDQTRILSPLSPACDLGRWPNLSESSCPQWGLRESLCRIIQAKGSIHLPFFPSAEHPPLSRKQTKMNQGLRFVEGTWSHQEGAEIQSWRPGCDRGGGAVSSLFIFSLYLYSSTLPRAGRWGAAGNQWSDILGSLFAPRAGRLCSRPTFPGLSLSGLHSLGRLPRMWLSPCSLPSIQRPLPSAPSTGSGSFLKIQGTEASPTPQILGSPHWEVERGTGASLHILAAGKKDESGGIHSFLHPS